MKGKLHAPHDPFAHMPPGQTYPQAPQLAGSEFKSVHIPLQQAAPVAQQT
jgi:hypothetical protein